MKIDFDTDELHKLVDQLSLLERSIAAPVLKEALRRAAAPVLQAAKDLAPKDTLLLMNSLKIKHAKAPRGGVSVRVTTEAGDYKGETYYGAFVEYGYRRGARSKKKGGPGYGKDAASRDKRPIVPAQPYMRPAADEQGGNALRIATDYLKSEVERLAPK